MADPVAGGAAFCPVLAAQAAAGRERAYAPYTKRRAGAALRLDDGRVVTGAAFENAAYMHGYSALESALAGLVAGGDARAGAISAIHLCWDDKPDYAAGWPDEAGLGLARQFAAPGCCLFLSWDGGGEVLDAAAYGFAAACGAAVCAKTACADADEACEEKAGGDAVRGESRLPLFSGGILRGLYDVRLNGFAPVSRYFVGAMAESVCGHVFYGCNVEMGGNKSLHAEGSALAAMVTALGPAARLRRVTLLTAGRMGTPCGGCRQYMSEFAGPETEIVLMNVAGERRVLDFAGLLPFSFGNDDLESAG